MPLDVKFAIVSNSVMAFDSKFDMCDARLSDSGCPVNFAAKLADAPAPSLDGHTDAARFAHFGAQFDSHLDVQAPLPPRGTDTNLSLPISLPPAEKEHMHLEETLFSLLDYGESVPFLDHGEDLHNSVAVVDPKPAPAVNKHDKALDNDGEITTKHLSAIDADDPVKDPPIFASHHDAYYKTLRAQSLLGYEQSSIAPGERASNVICCRASLDPWPAIKDHAKHLNNDGESTTKHLSTIALDDPIKTE